MQSDERTFTVTYANGDSVTYSEKDLTNGFDETCFAGSEDE